MKGKEYEKMVDAFNKRFMQDYFVYHQSDIPYFAMNTGMTRSFKPEHLPDFLYLHRSKPQFLLECKYSDLERFVLGRVNENQLKMLEKFSRHAGESYILLGFREGRDNRLFTLENIKK